MVDPVPRANRGLDEISDLRFQVPDSRFQILSAVWSPDRPGQTAFAFHLHCGLLPGDGANQVEYERAFGGGGVPINRVVFIAGEELQGLIGGKSAGAD